MKRSSTIERGMLRDPSTQDDLAKLENEALPIAFKSMRESGTYVANLVTFYEDAFFQGKAPSAAHTKEATKCLQEAIQLVFSNIHNASSTITSFLECQVSSSLYFWLKYCPNDFTQFVGLRNRANSNKIGYSQERKLYYILN